MTSRSLDVSPQDGHWAEFLGIHAESLWQCDFFSKRIWTRSGIRQYSVLVFPNVATRKVFVSPCCWKVAPAWMQAEAFVRHVGFERMPGTIVMRDRNSKYREVFDTVLKAKGAKVKKTSIRCPNLQAYVERFIQSIQQECLDQFIVCGSGTSTTWCRNTSSTPHGAAASGEGEPASDGRAAGAERGAAAGGGDRPPAEAGRAAEIVPTCRVIGPFRCAESGAA